MPCYFRLDMTKHSFSDDPTLHRADTVKTYVAQRGTASTCVALLSMGWNHVIFFTSRDVIKVVYGFTMIGTQILRRVSTLLVWKRTNVPEN